MVSLDFFYEKFDIDGIIDDKMIILIDSDIIKMTDSNLNFIRKRYQNQKFYFIRKNIKEYIDIMENTLFSQEELLEILNWNISVEFKIRLLEFSDEEISVIGKNYSSEICLYILNNNLAESDLFNLFASFEQWDTSIQVKILEYAISNISDIIDNPNSISEKLKNNLICSDKVSRDIKIDLLIAMMPNLNEASIKEFLMLLKLTDYLKIFDIHSRPKFEANTENKKLLTAFKRKKLIDNYEECSEKEGYYKIIRFKLQTKRQGRSSKVH